MSSGRYYNCSRCSAQVVICRKCDRGNIYCGSICSNKSRTERHQAANRKYSATLKGRRNHALRQRRYRARQKQKVTDQGSPILALHDVLQPKPNASSMRPQASNPCCHLCGLPVSYLRYDFLRHHADSNLNQKRASWPLGP